MTTGRSPEPVPARPQPRHRPADRGHPAHRHPGPPNPVPPNPGPPNPGPPTPTVATPPSAYPRPPRRPGGALADALVALREAAAAARFALDIPGAEGARESGAELVRAARRLRAAPPAPPRRPAAHRRRRLHRRGQVDRWSTAWSARRSAPPGCCAPPPARPCSSATPTTLRWFSDDPRAARPGPHRAGRRRRPPARCSSSPSPRARPRAGAARRPGHRLRRRPPTARCATQLLAAADLWLFVTTAARYADAVPWELSCTPPRSAAPRWRCCSTGCRRAPRTTSPPHLRRDARPRTGSAGRRCSSSPRRALDGGPAARPGRRPAARLVLGLAARRRRPRRGRPRRPSTARWTACAGRVPARLAARGRAQAAAAGAAARTSTRAYAGAAPTSTTACATGRCCAARCWPAGRSSSAPASSARAAVPGRPDAATGSPRRSPAGRRPRRS